MLKLQKNKILQDGCINDADYVVCPQKKEDRCNYYKTWCHIRERCYSLPLHKNYPTYIGCTMCEEWKSFMNFRSWMMAQDWKGKNLDKDIIEPGNKLYSPDKCAFISEALNNFLTYEKKNGSPYPVGVTKAGDKFMATCTDGKGKPERLGAF